MDDHLGNGINTAVQASFGSSACLPTGIFSSWTSRAPNKGKKEKPVYLHAAHGARCYPWNVGMYVQIYMLLLLFEYSSMYTSYRRDHFTMVEGYDQLSSPETGTAAAATLYLLCSQLLPV